MGDREEVRVHDGSALQVRQGPSSTGPGKLEGLAAVYSEKSNPLPDPDGNAFIEVIEPGAFDDTDLSDVRVLFNHDANMVIARNRSGTADVSSTSEGLFFRAELPDSPLGRNIGESVQRGDVDQASFAFVVREGGARWERRARRAPIRHLTDIAIVSDVSPVTFPAYPQTSVDARQAQRELRAFEKAGCPDGWTWNEDRGTCEREVCETEVRLLDARLDAAAMDIAQDATTTTDTPRLGYSRRAAHEAGHVCMMRHLGLDFDKAWVATSGGGASFDGRYTDREEALVAAASCEAEKMLGFASYSGSRSDESKLKAACRRMVMGNRTVRHHAERVQVAKAVQGIRQEAHRILAQRREQLAHVARRLEREGELTSADFVA